MTGIWTALRFALVAIMIAPALFGGAVAAAQERWPSRAVTLVVPVGPGTITDVAGRLLADHLRDIFGQPFVVENRPGAGATIGARYVARAAPDGYTLLMGGNTTHSSAPSLFKSPPYDPVADFTPIARIGKLGQFLSTNTQQSFKTFQEMVNFARANPGELSYGHGNASAQIIGETIKHKLGLNILRVPYSSNPTALTDLLSNTIQLMPIDFLNGVPLVEAKRIVALAVATKVRYGTLPDTPTLHETLIPEFEVLPWMGLFGPPALPRSIVEQLSNAIGKIMSSEGFVKSLVKLGPEPYYLASGPFTDFVRDDVRVWTEHARIAGIEPR
ncbi:MAG: Bug family tripartite tricarboxylate transporter substrate binding protein [Thermomicrobiales bacterium]